MREKNISHVVVKLLFDNKGLLRYISKLNQAFCLKTSLDLGRIVL